MRVLGIDPGLGRCGWGIVAKIGDRDSLKVIDYGCVETDAGLPLGERLLDLYAQLSTVCTQYSPTSCALETLFFSSNTKTAMMVSRASGVIYLVAMQNGLSITEYTPSQIKIAVTGYGSADKKQMETMVTRLLGLSEVPTPDDTADALAIALCHAVSSPHVTPA